MRYFIVSCACLAAVLLLAGQVGAPHQHKPGGAAAQGDDAAAPAPRGDPGAAGGAGTPGRAPMMMGPCTAPGGSPSMSMMDGMMHQAMGGTTDPASMGMAEALAAGGREAATMGRMLQMRGEILEAVGEIMLRYGKTLDGAK